MRACASSSRRANDVIEVPVDAVSHDDEDRATVQVIGSDGKTSARQVELGLANNKSVEVVHGLQAGEHLAVEPPAEAGGD